MAANWNSATSLLLVVAFVGLRIALRARECFDGDEIFSLEVARHSWPQLWVASAYDVSHPPLFYALLKVWIAIGGDSRAWLRLLPTSLAIAALVPFWGFCRALDLRSDERNFTLALLSMCGALLYYSSHVRMYSLLQLTSLCSLWSFAEWLRSQKQDWRTPVLMLAANAALVYSHYWGWILLGCEGLYVLAFAPRRFPRFCLNNCLLALAYIPWAVAVVSAAAARGSYTSQISWITRPSVFNVVWYYSAFPGVLPFRHSSSLILALTWCPIILWAWAAIKQHDRLETFQFLIWFAILPVLLTFGISRVLKQSVWAERSLIICVVPYLMLISIAACRLSFKGASVIPILLAAWSLTSGIVFLTKPQKVQWDVLAAQIQKAESAAELPVPVYTSDDVAEYPLRFYFKAQGTPSCLDTKRIDPQKIGTVTDRHWWFVYCRSIHDNMLFDQPPENILAAQGYRLGTALQTSAGPLVVRALPVWTETNHSGERKAGGVPPP